MNLSYTQYAPGTANVEYQERLRNQRMADEATAARTPAGHVAPYKLAERTPVWEMLLHIRTPKAWSTRSLSEGIERLRDPETTPKEYPILAKAQIAAFEAELASRI
jgi:hypothetical protein